MGAVVLGLALLVHVAVTGWDPTFPGEWWLYLGGLNGCLFIAAQAVIVRTTGVLLMALGLLAGQLIAAVAFDLVLPISDGALHLATVIGAALVLVAVVVASIPSRRSRGPAPTGS